MEHHTMDWGTMGGAMWVGMLVWGILGLVLIVLGILWLVRHLGPEERHRHLDRTSLGELEGRYARGEIDRETFLAIRRDLEADDG